MKEITEERDGALKEEIAGLREKLQELTVRLQTLEADEGSSGNGKTSSRRDLLKLAGAPKGGSPCPGPQTRAPVFPGFAPLQAIGGVVVPVPGTKTLLMGEGVDAFAALDFTDANARAAGVLGQSDYGLGVAGAGGL